MLSVFWLLFICASLVAHPSQGDHHSGLSPDTPLSVLEDTPTKQIQGYPYQTNGAEGNPIEGNPQKGLNTPLRRGLPCSEQEAIAQGSFAGVPEDFARDEYNRMEAVDWLDGCQRQVRSWRHYIAQRWSKEKSGREERKTRAVGRVSQSGRALFPNGETIPMRRFRLQKEIKEQTQEVDTLHRGGHDYREAEKELRELEAELQKLDNNETTNAP